MKTERRHDLRSNELAQQIDQFGAYVKQNAGRLLTGGAIVIALALAVFWFFSGRKAAVMEGWSTLSDSTLAADPAAAVAKYRSIAQDARGEELAIAAWLRIGETAMQQMIAGSENASGTATAAEDWPAVAKEAYERVLERSGTKNPTARGQALMMLGVLAEDRGEFDKARDCYKQVAEEDKLAATPLPDQARFRLNGLASWSAPVDFPPAALVAPAKDSSAAAADAPPGERVIMSQKIDLATGKVIEGDSDVPVATLIEMKPPTTTQPAGDDPAEASETSDPTNSTNAADGTSGTNQPAEPSATTP